MRYFSCKQIFISWIFFSFEFILLSDPLSLLFIYLCIQFPSIQMNRFSLCLFVFLLFFKFNRIIFISQPRFFLYTNSFAINFVLLCLWRFFHFCSCLSLLSGLFYFIFLPSLKKSLNIFILEILDNLQYFFQYTHTHTHT